MARGRTLEQKIRQAASQRRRYAAGGEASRAYVREKVARVRSERGPLIDKLKIERGCIDCGYRGHPAALHFDHRDPRLKSFAISKALTRSWASILGEIEKCDVRCANCHAIRGVREGHLGRPRIGADPVSLNQKMVDAGYAVVYNP